MNTRGWMLVAGAVLLTAATVVAQQPVTTGPKLVVPEKILDKGTVAQGEVVEANFKLVNEGTEPIQVKAVRPTCGCTVADFDREIPAGGEGWIRAKLDTTDYSGPVSKSILIMTNDPQDPTMTVVIKADVKPYVEVLPRPLMRFNAVKHEAMSQKVTVVASEDDPGFKVTGVDSNVPYLETTVRPAAASERVSGKPDEQYEVVLTLAEDAPVGPVNAELVVHTNHPKAPNVAIKVYGVVRDLIHVTPPQIQFGTVDAKTKPGRSVIVVNNRTEGTTEVSAAEIGDPAFSTELLTIEEGRRFQVTVTIKPDAEPGVHDTTLVLHTTDPEYPELTVPVRADIR